MRRWAWPNGKAAVLLVRMTGWTAVLLTAAGCYALKVTGWLVPSQSLGRAARRALFLLPIALLSGLVVVQAFAAGRSLQLDARSAGLAAAAVALLARAPFLLVVVAAAATAAAVRAVW